MKPHDMRYKRIKLRPLDSDPTLLMRFRALNHDLYNSTFKTRACLMIQWTFGSRDPRVSLA